MTITATKYTGRQMLFKVGSVADPAVAAFTVMGGVRVKGHAQGVEEIDISDGDDGVWKKLLEGGIQNLTLNVSGLVSNDAQFEIFKTKAQGGLIWAYQLDGEADGDSVKGKFQISSLEVTGDFKGAQEFTATLVSADTPTFTNA